MTQVDHSKLIKKIAKERLKPHGITQYGQSRLYLQDKGWFVTTIEFQPSRWSKGTYLNVGVDLNFYPRNYFSLAFGSREAGFAEFKDQPQFENLINGLCDLAIKRVEELNLQFKDIETALKTADLAKADDTWKLYEVAILNALATNYATAQLQLEKVSNTPCTFDWEKDRKIVADKILVWLNEPSTFLRKMEDLIAETRELKKLPVLTQLF